MEAVNHPKHYKNKSGVEAIEVIRYFEFNTGNSFKYVYRRNDKKKCLEDLRKSLWYVKDEIDTRISKSHTFSFLLFEKFKIPNFLKYKEYKSRTELVNKIVEFEDDENVKEIYKLLNKADYYISDIASLHLAYSRIIDLIESQKI